MVLFLLRFRRLLHMFRGYLLFGPGLVVMRGGVAGLRLLLVVRVVILVRGGNVVVAEGDVVLGLPGVELFIIAFPLDVAELSVYMRCGVLLTHFIWTMF